MRFICCIIIQRIVLLHALCYIAFWVECGIPGPRNAEFLPLLQKLFCEREFVPSQKQAMCCCRVPAPWQAGVVFTTDWLSLAGIFVEQKDPKGTQQVVFSRNLPHHRTQH
jgi:hypothetical protein